MWVVGRVGAWGERVPMHVSEGKGGPPSACQECGRQARAAQQCQLVVHATTGEWAGSCGRSAATSHSTLPKLQVLPTAGVCACRTHAYGDVYSSPGLDLRQKQLLGCAFLGVAAMPDQLLGHAIAVGLGRAGWAALAGCSNAAEIRVGSQRLGCYNCGDGLGGW